MNISEANATSLLLRAIHRQNVPDDRLAEAVEFLAARAGTALQVTLGVDVDQVVANALRRPR